MTVRIFNSTIRHVGIISPAGKSDLTLIEQGQKFIESQGVKATVYITEPHSEKNYLAGSTADRLDALHNCFKDESIDAVFCTRGGFGSAHLLDHIDWELLQRRNIPLIGYSDITALHLACLKYRAARPLAGPMSNRLPELASDQVTLKSFARTLDLSCKLNHPPKKIAQTTVIKSGQACGGIIPLNLTVAASLCGSKYMIDFSNRIILLEDINEPLYKIDRCLTQMELSGCFNNCKGIIFGQFTNCGNTQALHKVFTEVAAKSNLPIVKNFPFGHEFPLVSLLWDYPLTITPDGAIFI